MRGPASISSSALKWLLLSQLLVLLPLTPHLPLWLVVIAGAMMLWRWQLHRGRWFYPGRWQRALLAVVVSGLLFANFRGSFGVETMLSLLVAGFVLKLTELRSRSDVYLLCFLTYFVIGTQLLFLTGFLGALYSFCCLAAITGTLVMTNASAGGQGDYRPWRTLGGLMLQALPVMLVLFLVVPRMGSLWTVPLNKSAGVTGVSDTMSPGDFSNLLQSDEPAFRVTFNGDLPTAGERYWRALVLDHFDGREWGQGLFQGVNAGRRSAWDQWHEELEPLGRQLSYEIMLEPTAKHWLYTLAIPQSFDDDIYVSRGFTLFQRKPVFQRKQYSVVSALEYRAQSSGLDDRERRSALALPDGYNPLTRRLAAEWAEQEGSPEALIQRFLQFVQRRFHYTLQPPVLGEHSVDEFLWETQTGFCEHFAGSFVFFMRAAGVPARVVVGYQGGQVNPHEGYLTVRQLDAHAWTEVWLEGQGWRRIDPTAAVAPQRIDRGVEYSLSEQDSALLGNALSRRFALLARAQLQWDAFNYRWHRWVMEYDQVQQQAFFQRLLGSAVPWKVVTATLAALALIIGIILLWLLWRRRPEVLPAEQRLYQRFCRKLAKAGYPRGTGESPSNYARRVATARPEHASQLWRVAILFEQVAYAGNPRALPEFKRLVRRLQLRSGR
ncbi:transglutaminase TgpA family protein [Gilvimarinus algae]|uniref:DUF3488 and transglutaminase-like domain-containing protein n=1 Tax=Gilvimarinus algae TaxID=3058037 RepID=A0ABT8TM41_9GAMM|nr:DUF3488 and transglutaminase-like domain-containing protein [Gilvimarinus sp. SDUM040014]MDO3384163.1 DUF3488 and transglutaminase-like domain-containing protein [Gilvimarinus sp. SDUM040014]